MKIYIAGPMSGLPESNRQSFHAAAAHLTKLGHIALNPATLPDDLTQADYMAICIAMLQRAEAIYMLNGWQQSVGAKAEVALAEKRGLVLFAEEISTSQVSQVTQRDGFYQYDDGAINEKAQQLLTFVARLEQAANRGLEINQERDPSIPAEKVISAEQCEWVLKDCILFRSAIFDVFGLPQ